MKKAKAIFNKIISVLSTLILIFSVFAVIFTLFSKSGKKVQFIGKYAAVRIVSESMQPYIDPGDYILIEKVSAESLKEGDIITFVSSDPKIEGQLNTHRIVKIEGTTITTKGDNNPVEDAYKVSFSSVVGRYKKSLGFLSGVGNIFTNPIGYVILIAVPMMFIISGYMRSIAESISEEKKEKEKLNELSEADQVRLMLEEMKKSGELDRRVAELDEKENNKS